MTAPGEDEPDPDVDPDDQHIVAAMSRAGFDVHPTMRAPFKAVSEDEREHDSLLTGHSEFTQAAEKRARIMSSVGEVVGTASVYVVDRTSRESVDGTALIEREEIEEIDDAEDLKDLVRERGERPA